MLAVLFVLHLHVAILQYIAVTTYSGYHSHYDQGCQVQVNKKCQTTCKKYKIASKNAKQPETD